MIKMQVCKWNLNAAEKMKYKFKMQKELKLKFKVGDAVTVRVPRKDRGPCMCVNNGFLESFLRLVTSHNIRMQSFNTGLMN